MKQSVRVGPWPDSQGWSARYVCTSGCCDAAYRDMSEAEKGQALQGLALDLVMQGAKPSEVEREFSKIRLWHEAGVLLPQGWVPKATLDNRWSPHNNPEIYP